MFALTLRVFLPVSLRAQVPEIKRMSDEEVAATRLAMDKLKVRGKRVPKPIKKWTQCGLSDAVLAVIEKSGYAAPFPIQSQALPTIMQAHGTFPEPSLNLMESSLITKEPL